MHSVHISQVNAKRLELVKQSVDGELLNGAVVENSGAHIL